MKGLGRTFLKALGAAVATLLVMEAGLRWLRHDEPADRAIAQGWDRRGDSPLHIRSPDRTMVYELRPNATVAVERFGQTYTTNADGFRDGPFTTPKPADVYRIVAIGDSITFGWTQPVTATWPKVLERLFAEAGGYKGKRVEVFNLGIGGYNSAQEVELLKTRGLRYEPDLIVIGFCLNDGDIGVDNGLWDHFHGSGSALYDFVETRIERLQPRESYVILTDAFNEFGQVSRERRTPVVVALFPDLKWGSDGVYPLSFAHEKLTELSRKNGLEPLDLAPPFLQAGLSAVKDGDDRTHPNSTGLRVAAQSLFEYLRKR